MGPICSAKAAGQAVRRRGDEEKNTMRRCLVEDVPAQRYVTRVYVKYVAGVN